MIIGTTEVLTPKDSPLQFDPAWRYQVGRSWAEEPSFAPPYASIANDPYVIAFRDYSIQSNAAPNDAMVEPKLQDIKIALDWYSRASVQSPKYYIEPLLLTGATYDVISKDMGGGHVSQETFKLYEKLFFNVRDDDTDEVTSSCYRRTYCAMPDSTTTNDNSTDQILWRVAATQYGYSGLIRMWFWRGYAGPTVDEVALQREFMNTAQSLIMRRMLRGQINSFDLNTVFTNYIQYERMRQETGKEKDLSVSPESLLLKVLGIMRPQMLTASQTTDELTLLNKALQDRISAQKAIQSKAIVDKGLEATIEKIDSMIAGQFTNVS